MKKLSKLADIAEYILAGNNLLVPPEEVGPDRHGDFEILTEAQLKSIPFLQKVRLLLPYPHQLVVVWWFAERCGVITVVPHNVCPPPVWWIFDMYYELRNRRADVH